MNKNLGFTLIEMLVAMALFITIATAGYTAFFKFSSSKDLDNATQDALNLINQAKISTLSQVNASDCLPNSYFLGYQIKMNDSNHTYILSRGCVSKEGDPTTATYTIVKTLPIPDSVSLSLEDYYGHAQLRDVSPMQFQFLASQGATLDDTYENTLTLGSVTKKIVVSDKGSISLSNE